MSQGTTGTATGSTTGTATGPATWSRGVTGELLARLRDEENRPALGGYLPVGFPTPARSVEALKTMVDQGIDMIELGVPYTDPVLDGPVVQAAAQGALDAGTRLADVFRVLSELTAYAPQVPVVVMTYWNPVLRYGVERFARDLAAAGGAGLITPDLIPDEGADWLAASDAHAGGPGAGTTAGGAAGLDRVFLVAPSSTPERLRLTVSASRGFVYATSVMGVTGARATVGERAEQLVADTRAAGAEQVCVGLGVSTAEQAREVGRYADGVIVGSALVRTLLGENLPGPAVPGPPHEVGEDEWAARLAKLGALTADLADGVRSARVGPGASTVPGDVS
jgi:tryptophan synthase alpha chain